MVIFVALLVANLILFLLTAGLGLGILLTPGTSVDRHILLAVMSLVLSCLIQVTAFTYLTVSGKVLAQAVHLGGLDRGAIEQAKEIKKKLTRYLAACVASIVVVTATGASAWGHGKPSYWHLMAAAVLIAVHLFAWRREYLLLKRNAALVTGVLADYEARRRAAKTSRLPA